MTGPADAEIDPDVGTDALTAPHPLLLLAVIAAGGALGTLGRYELGRAWPTATPTSWSWATLTGNVTGAFALGLLVTVVGRWRPDWHYLRPALGTGLLGGWTTFSTYLVETVQRLDHGAAPLGLAYCVVTLAAGLAAAWLGLLAGAVKVSR